MKTRIDELLIEAKNASQSPGAYGFLPGIIKSLEAIQDELEKDGPDPEILVKRVGGLGRLVTESYAFSESPLGTKLLDLITEIVSRYDSAWPYN